MEKEFALTADDVIIKPAHITLKLTPPSIATYKIFGYTHLIYGGTRVELKTVEGETKMSLPINRVKEIIIEF